MVGENEPRRNEAGRGTLRERILRYTPFLGLVFAALGGVLGTAYLMGGKDFVYFVLSFLSRWNAGWMILAVFTFYLLAWEVTDTQWFRRFGIEMMHERLQALVLALVLGSFCLVVPFRDFWTNYWLLRDGRPVRAVVTDVREHGGVGYHYMF